MQKIYIVEMKINLIFTKLSVFYKSIRLIVCYTNRKSNLKLDYLKKQYDKKYLFLRLYDNLFYSSH